MRFYRNAGILIIVCAVLFGVYYYASNRPVEEEIFEDEDTTIRIFRAERDEIVKIAIKTEEQNLVFAREEEEWMLKSPQNPQAKLEQSRINILMFNVANINADRIVEEDAEDLSLYGLDNPTSVVTVNLADGEEQVFHVGKRTPSRTLYYFRKQDDNTVYTINSHRGDSLTSTLERYRDKDLFEINPEEIKSFVIEGEERDTIAIRLKEEHEIDGMLAAWQMTEPFNRSANGHNVEEIILISLPDIGISNFVADEPEDLAVYGLDTPKYRLAFTNMEDETITLLLGNVEDSMIYMQIEGQQPVYLIGESAVAFRDIQSFKLLERLAYIVNIDFVDRIEIEVNDKVSVMEIIRHHKKTEEGEEIEEEYLINGEQADERKFKRMYQQVIGFSIDGNIEDRHRGDIEGTPDVRYTFYHNDGREDVVMEYVSISHRHYAVVRNGKCEFYILQRKVEQMVEDLEIFENNPM